MVYLQIEDIRVKQYSVGKDKGKKKIFSGRIESKHLKPLIGREVCIRARLNGQEKKFLTEVKFNKTDKIPYVSSTVLKDFINDKVDVDIIETE